MNDNLNNTIPFIGRAINKAAGNEEATQPTQESTVNNNDATSTTSSTTTADIPEAPAEKKVVKIDMVTLIAIGVVYVIATYLLALLLVNGLVALFGVVAGCSISLVLSGVMFYFGSIHQSTSAKLSSLIVRTLEGAQGLVDSLKNRKATKTAKKAAALDEVTARFAEQGSAA